MCWAYVRLPEGDRAVKLNILVRFWGSDCWCFSNWAWSCVACAIVVISMVL